MLLEYLQGEQEGLILVLNLGSATDLKGFVCGCGRQLSEIIKKNNLDVLYKCEFCGKEIKIPVSDFKKIVH